MRDCEGTAEEVVSISMYRHFFRIKVDATYNRVQLCNNIINIIKRHQSHRIHQNVESVSLSGRQNGVEKAHVHRNYDLQDYFYLKNEGSALQVHHMLTAIGC